VHTAQYTRGVLREPPAAALKRGPWQRAAHTDAQPPAAVLANRALPDVQLAEPTVPPAEPTERAARLVPMPTTADSAGGTRPLARSSSRRRWPAWLTRLLAELELPGALLLSAAVFAFIQNATVNIIGVDGYYHIKVAELIRLHGPRLDFPWLRYTILNESAYTDHHLLFHMLQAPFTLFALGTAAKLSSIVFATLSFAGIFLFMRLNRLRWPLLWLVLLLAVAPQFLWRQSMARPQSLAVLLLVGVFWALVAGRSRWLVPLGFVSAWLFDGFVLPLAVPAAWLGARLFLERRLDWRPLALLVLGTAVGLVIHPYFPSNVIFAYLHLSPKAGLAESLQVPVGSEWSPFTSSAFARQVGPSLGVMVVGMLPLLVRLWRQQRPDPGSLTMLLVAIGFLGMVIKAQRMIEYYPAFAVLSAAWSWSKLGLPLRPRFRRALLRWQPLLYAASAAGLLVWLWSGVPRAQNLARSGISSANITYYRDASAWLKANSPPGSLVFNTDWDDFPQLFFWNDHNVYVVGLDLTYLSIYSPDLYRRWRAIAFGNDSRPSESLRRDFGADFVFSDTNHGPFLQAAANDPGLEEAFRSSTAVVFRVKS
jgi:hypothetical protein